MYNDFLKAAKQLFMEHGISLSKTDALEETLLKIAGISKKLRNCKFDRVLKPGGALLSAAYDEKTQTYSEIIDVSSSLNNRLFFAIRGLDTNDNEQLLNYLKQDPQAAVSYYFNDKMNAHYFEVNVTWASDFLLPIVKKHIQIMLAQNDPDLQSYQTKSKGTPEAEVAHLLEPICHLEKYLNDLAVPPTASSNLSCPDKSLLIQKLSLLRSAIIDLSSHQLILERFNNFKAAKYSQLNQSDLTHATFNSNFEQLTARVDQYVLAKQNARQEQMNQQKELANNPRLKRYYIRPPQWDDADNFLKTKALPRAFSQLAILSKNRLNLPENIETLVASHTINYHGLSFFSNNKTILNNTKDSTTKITYAQKCFTLFKSLTGKSAAEKEQQYEAGAKSLAYTNLKT